MNYYDTSRWSTVEICLGIVCTCLPTTRLLLVRLFPVLGGTSQRRASGYFFRSADRMEHKARERGAVKDVSLEAEWIELERHRTG